MSNRSSQLFATLLEVWSRRNACSISCSQNHCTVSSLRARKPVSPITLLELSVSPPLIPHWIHTSRAHTCSHAHLTTRSVSNQAISLSKFMGVHCESTTTAPFQLKVLLKDMVHSSLASPNARQCGEHYEDGPRHHESGLLLPRPE